MQAFFKPILTPTRAVASWVFALTVCTASPQLLAQAAVSSAHPQGTPAKNEDGLSQWLNARGMAASLDYQTQSSPTSTPAPQADPAPSAGFAAQLGDFFNPFLNRTESLTAKATDLLNRAAHFLGVPYKRGGTDEGTGFDCSGFVQNLYKTSTGLLLPRTAAEQARSTDQISKTELVAGDLVFFNTLKRAFSHVGIYVGDGKFVHAPRPGAQVRVDNMNLPYWTSRFNGARRVGVLHDDSPTPQ